MLKSWFIQNFKPILDSGDLQLAPVTVLAGRNSSGKSSLIQSILMVAQTLSNRILDRALLPYGPIIQLGTFEDILSEQTNLRTMVVGFELEMEQEEPEIPKSIRIGEEEGILFVSGLGTDIRSVKITAQFRSASSNGTSASAIEASKVSVESVALEITTFPPRQLSGNQLSLFPENESITPSEFILDIRRITSEELEGFLKDVSPEYLRLVPYTAAESNYRGEFILSKITPNARIPDPSLITFSHFLPRRLIGKYIIEERRKLNLINTAKMMLNLPGDNYITGTKGGNIVSEIYDDSITLPDNLREEIASICKDYEIQPFFSGNTLGELINWYRSLRSNKKRNLIAKVMEIIPQVISDKSVQQEKSTQALEAITNNIYVEKLEGAVDQTTQFFTSKIRYLGPLRADPQAVQKFAPSSELDDVGAKGEYAAAVYDANQNAIIQWYHPLAKQTEHSALKVALDTWVRYLGVVDEVKIQIAGQSGVSWQVVPMKGHKALPLTAVGVGVSQILPILVMGLLAPHNTLLLVEQPELHLHPSVQARLGDFFMGLAKCKKQCLIETHSENLVSQLRYHIVEAEGQEKDNCLIYFVDQDERGSARFNPIEISAQGNILNWPNGFFDETMLQEDRITAASLKKRAKK